MKRPDRQELVFKWRCWSWGSFGVSVLVWSGALAKSLPAIGHPAAVNFSQTILAVPGVPTVASLLPTGKLLVFPAELVIAAAFLLFFAVCQKKLIFHKQRLAEEDKARDLRDI